jgi:hypothetical protein
MKGANCGKRVEDSASTILILNSFPINQSNSLPPEISWMCWHPSHGHQLQVRSPVSLNSPIREIKEGESVDKSVSRENEKESPIPNILRGVSRHRREGLTNVWVDDHRRGRIGAKDAP